MRSRSRVVCKLKLGYYLTHGIGRTSYGSQICDKKSIIVFVQKIFLELCRVHCGKAIADALDLAKKMLISRHFPKFNITQKVSQNLDALFQRLHRLVQSLHMGCELGSRVLDVRELSTMDSCDSFSFIWLYPKSCSNEFGDTVILGT